MSPPPVPSQKSNLLFAAVVTAVFAGLAAAGLYHHELWRDELHVWLLADSSSSLRDLFANMRTEGHPSLWYLINFLLTRFTHNVVALQVFNLVCGAASVWLVCRHAPLNKVQKLLLSLGYIFLFEYTIITRIYALEVLLLLLSCHLIMHPQMKRRNLWLGISLFLLTQTLLHGAVLASGLVLLILMREKPKGRQLLPLVAGCAGILLTLAHVGYQSQFASYFDDMYYASAQHNGSWLLRVFTAPMDGILPMPAMNADHFWNTHLLRSEGQPILQVCGALITLALLALCVVLLRKDKKVLLIWAIVMLVLWVLAAFFFEGYTRHHIQFFFALLAAYWLMPRQEKQSMVPGGALTLMFAIQFLAGAYAFAADWQRPFSNAGRVAYWLTHSEFENMPLCANIDFTATPITYYMGRPAFSAQSASQATWIWWAANDWDRSITQPGALQRFDSLSHATGEPVMVILSLPVNLVLDSSNYQNLIPSHSGPDLNRYFYIESFTGAIVEDENYLLYVIGDLDRGKRYSLLDRLSHRLLPENLPDSKGSLLQAFDKIEKQDSVLTIAGWAFVKDHDNTGARTSVVLRSDEYGYIFRAPHTSRPDVLATYPEACTDSTGFHFTYRADWIPPGKYEVGTLLITADGDSAFNFQDSLLVK